jgi:hypothetical protein
MTQLLRSGKASLGNQQMVSHPSPRSGRSLLTRLGINLPGMVLRCFKRSDSKLLHASWLSGNSIPSDPSIDIG